MVTIIAEAFANKSAEENIFFCKCPTQNGVYTVKAVFFAQRLKAENEDLKVHLPETAGKVQNPASLSKKVHSREWCFSGF